MSIPLILAMALLIKRASGAHEFLAWASLLPAFWTIWLAWFRLEVDDKFVRYRRPFRKAESLAWKDIASVEARKVLSNKKSQPMIPLSTIIVTPAGGTRRLVINPRVFPARGLHECFEYMQSRT